MAARVEFPKRVVMEKFDEQLSHTLCVARSKGAQQRELGLVVLPELSGTGTREHRRVWVSVEIRLMHAAIVPLDRDGGQRRRTVARVSL